ncbi:protein phosphatase 2C domain-containing protein [Kitasatospora sp. NPDC059646]|uniref:protein phosphatase 2C domain-containing protein n=1 Tax=Kitasatospora sp. NPDC059646 TaxID=3346893 RepID=UPI0036B85F1B
MEPDDPSDGAGGGPGDGWRLTDRQVRGPHKARCQDRTAAEELPGPDGDLAGVLLAVADGHGSAAHGRSHLGAEFAVAVFLRLARRFAAAALSGRVPLPALRAEAQQRLPWNLVREWEDRCAAHLRAEPLEGFPEPPPGPLRDRSQLVPYGTTLLGAALLPGLLVAWQLGDGDLALVDRSSGAVLLPLAPAAPELGDETDSLCSKDAARLVRTHWSPIVGAAEPPGLLLLSTDGLSKSFAEPSGFEAFAAGLYRRLLDDGHAAVVGQLGGWLERAASFSGDDTSVALAWYDDPHRPAGRQNPDAPDGVHRPDPNATPEESS